MNQWCKLASSIVHSTLWREELHIKVTWITMLALKDYMGNVEGSIPGLAHIAGVSIEQCEEALNKFRSPDKYSRSKKDDGRRIRDIDGGWFIINHEEYRDMKDEQRKAYQRNWAKNNRKAQKEELKKLKKHRPLPGEASAAKALANGDQDRYDQLAAARFRESKTHPPALD